MRFSFIPSVVGSPKERGLAVVTGLLALILCGGVSDIALAGPGVGLSPMKPGPEVAPGVREVGLILPQGLESVAHSGSGVLLSPDNVGLIAAKPVSVTGAQDWTTLFADDFESGFPGTAWSLDPEGIGPYWDDWTCWSNSASFSVGCAAGAISCGQDYLNDLFNWMIAGPVSLADPTITAGVLECSLNLESEAESDFFYMLVSVDGVNFNGFSYTGTISQTISIDLTNVPSLDNIPN